MSRSVRRTRVLAGAGVAVASLVVAVAPAIASPPHAAIRPAVGSVTAFAWSHPGGVLPATVKIVNRRSATTPRTTLRLYLSADKRLSRADDALPGVPVRGLRPHRHVTERLQLRLPKHAHLGRRWLLGCISGHCTASAHPVHVTATPKTSASLIDAARATHAISAGTAAVYKVFAAFGDSRLPARFQGDDPALTGDSATRGALAMWRSLSAKQRAIVGGFMQGVAGSGEPGQPAATAPHHVAADAAAGGCQHRGPDGNDMAHVDAPGGHIRIWWPRTGLPRVAKAVPRVARDAEYAWAKLAALMGRTPVSDGSYCGRNGGDGRYDIFLVNGDGGVVRGRAVTGPYKGYSLTQPAPAVTLFNCWADDPPTGWAVAHELFHAFQFAYPHAEPITRYDGFDEGSADWAANYVFPRADYEHYDDSMLRAPDYFTLPDNDYGYELWPFDLYLTQKFGNDLMPEIYRAFAHQAVLPALNSAIPGGFEKRLPDFARYGWNQPPVKGGFRSWDRFTAVPRVHQLDLRIGGLEHRTANVPDSLKPLARAYYPFHVADSNIRDLRFDNTVHGIQGASVRAFVKLADGTWHTQDWTNRRTVEFCRDAGPEQNVTDLIIMYGNARYQDTKPLAPAKQPTLEIKNNCDHYYVVTAASGSYTENFSYTDTNDVYPCTDSGTQQYTVTRDPVRQDALHPYDASWAPGKYGAIFAPLSISGSDNYQQSNCQGGTVWRDPCTSHLSDVGSHLGSFGAATAGGVAVQLPPLAHMPDYFSTDNACDSTFNYTPGNDPVDYLDAGKVSVATLEGSAPFTLSASNTYTDDTGHTYTRSLSVTLQPTDENGRPLG